MEIQINKEVLFELISSHAFLAEAEYNRNPGYNDTHFSHIAEEAIVKELQSKGLWDECLTFLIEKRK